MRRLFLVLFLTVIMASVAIAQKVIVKPFDLGKASGMPESFWGQHDPLLKVIVDLVLSDPNLGVKLSAQVDGHEFSESSDAKNGGLAWDRIFILKLRLLLLGLPASKIVEETAYHVKEKGDDYRWAMVEIVDINDYAKKSDLKDFATKKDLDKYAKKKDLDKFKGRFDDSMNDFNDSLASIRKRISFFSNLRLGIGIGFSSAEKVDWVPRFNASIDYGKIVYVIFNYDHSIFTRDQWLPKQQGFGYEEKATWNREYELLVAFFPTYKFPAGLFVGGGQYENLVKDEDTYTLRRRAVPFGLLWRGGPVMCRLSTNYGFSDNYNEREVKWGIGALTASITFNLYLGGAK